MSKLEVLTEEECAGFCLSGELVAFIEEVRRSFGVERESMRLLDWGCGRGRSVVWLREQGYDACGVDVDPDVIARGGELLRARDDDAGVLRVLSPGGSTGFEAGRFHLILSQNVLEHVDALGEAAAEMFRVTAAGGLGLHSFPAKWRPIEGHLRMPVVHWLPKNGLRRGAIAACVGLGVEPRWATLQGVSRPDRSRAYYAYSAGKTFYRGPGHVARVFERAGFEARVRLEDHSGAASTPVRRAVGAVGGRVAVGAVLAHVGSTELVVRKASPATEPPPRR